jgi:N-acetylneuraminic acid mutarotase
MNSKFYLSFILCLSIILVNGDDRWEEIPQSNPQDGPINLGGHRLNQAYWDKSVITGGFQEFFINNSNTFYNHTYAFLEISHQWKRLADFSGPRAFHGAALDRRNNKLYICGGASYGAYFSNIKIYDDCQVLDLDTNTWSTLPPSGTTYGAEIEIALVGDNLYMFGGSNAYFSSSNAFYRFNIPTQTWTVLRANGAANTPPPRSSFFMKGFGDKLVITQGEALNAQGTFDSLTDTWVYDIQTNVFTNVTRPHANQNPPGISNTQSAAVIDGNLLIFGGDIPGGEAGCGAPFDQNPVDTTWSLDLDNYQWTLLHTENTPQPLKRVGGDGLRHGPLIIYGGWDFNCPPPGTENGQYWPNKFYRLNVGSNSHRND